MRLFVAFLNTVSLRLLFAHFKMKVPICKDSWNAGRVCFEIQFELLNRFCRSTSTNKKFAKKLPKIHKCHHMFVVRHQKCESGSPWRLRKSAKSIRFIRTMFKNYRKSRIQHCERDILGQFQAMCVTRYVLIARFSYIEKVMFYLGALVFELKKPKNYYYSYNYCISGIRVIRCLNIPVMLRIQITL